MPVTRRDFVTQSSLALTALTLPAYRLGTTGAQGVQGGDPLAKQLCMLALDAARGAGAQYADARVVAMRRQVVSVLGEQPGIPEEKEDLGFGVRVLVDGVWGYSSSPDVARRQAFRLAQEAVDQARAAGAVRHDIQLAPILANPDGEWRSPIRIDPFDISSEDKLELLVEANTEALRVRGVQSAASTIACMRVTTTFASTAGSLLEQTVYRTHPSMVVTASNGALGVSRTSSDVAPTGLGYEHVHAADLPGRAAAWADEALALLSAPPVEAGSYDVVLLPSMLGRVIHETIGRAAELDRALAHGESGDVTSFLTPPERMLNAFRFGPEFMNVQGDRTQRGALATVGWDDEGVPADAWPLVKDGVLADYHTTRATAARIAEYTGIEQSHGCADAESWRFPPLLRMPNVSLLPGEEGHTVDDLVAATDRGLLIEGHGPCVVGPQGLEFRIAGQLARVIRDGAVREPVRLAAIEGRSPDFWNSLDMLGGPDTYALTGVVDQPKGDPVQLSSASNGCPVARFRNVRVVTVSG
jgi:TldD protein